MCDLGKHSKHRGRKRKRRRRNLKEWIGHKWNKIQPYLLFLRKIIQDLTQSFMFDLFIFSVVGINTILLVAQTFAVVEIRGGKTQAQLLYHVVFFYKIFT